METRTNVVLALSTYERQVLWYVMVRPPGRRRQVAARGQWTHDLDAGPLDEFEALMEAAMEAYRLYGR